MIQYSNVRGNSLITLEKIKHNSKINHVSVLHIRATTRNQKKLKNVNKEEDNMRHSPTHSYYPRLVSAT